MPDRDALIYHLTTRVAWDAASEVGSYQVSTVGMTVEEVGFIHASTATQLDGTAQRFFRDLADELVVLVLDVERLEAGGVPVRYEDGGIGEDYPHLYAALPCHLVDRVQAAWFDESGRLVVAD
jgi:uncharacterized protein (DUF952 family)